MNKQKEMTFPANKITLHMLAKIKLHCYILKKILTSIFRALDKKSNEEIVHISLMSH